MIEPKQPFKLKPDERESLLWKRLMEHFGERLELARLQNDGNLDPTETARLRGRINELKTLMTLNEAPKQVEE